MPPSVRGRPARDLSQPVTDAPTALYPELAEESVYPAFACGGAQRLAEAGIWDRTEPDISAAAVNSLKR